MPQQLGGGLPLRPNLPNHPSVSAANSVQGSMVGGMQQPQQQQPQQQPQQQHQHQSQLSPGQTGASMSQVELSLFNKTLEHLFLVP